MTSKTLLNAASLVAVVASAALVVAKNAAHQDASKQFLNVSYDPTRELYRDLNAAFVADYDGKVGAGLPIIQSHGGSSRQARAVIDGAPADVVTLAVHSDIDALRKRGLIAEGWEKRLPNDSFALHVDDRVRRTAGGTRRTFTTGRTWCVRVSRS